MLRDELGDLAAFLVVAEERSFTRAAARLSTSQPALSLTEGRLCVKVIFTQYSPPTFLKKIKACFQTLIQLLDYLFLQCRISSPYQIRSSLLVFRNIFCFF